MLGKVTKALEAAADMMLPRRCIVCGRILLADEKHLCIYCKADLPLTYFWQNTHNPMADRFNAVLQESIICHGTSAHEPYAYAAGLFFYHNEAGYRQIPYQLKYHGNISVGKHFGKMLGERLASAGLFQDVDLVIPVPLHWTRKWKRGYNQAEIVATEVSCALHAKMDIHTLRRRRRTQTQTRLNVEDKVRNVEGAFEASGGYKEARHILLIDDVFTTGSTLLACHKALRTTFPAEVRISIATLGFVGD